MAEIKILKKVVCARGDLHGEIVGRSLFRRLTRDQPTPCFVAFMNNLGSIFFVLGFTRERKRILWFSIRNLVNPKLKPPSTSLSQLMFFFFCLVPEPFISRTNQTRQMPLHIFYIVEFRSERIGHVHDENFPIRFAFIEESHDTEYFDLFDLTYVADLFADLADVERVVVAFGFGLDVRLGGIFPCLCKCVRVRGRACGCG